MAIQERLALAAHFKSFDHRLHAQASRHTKNHYKHNSIQCRGCDKHGNQRSHKTAPIEGALGAQCQ